MFRTQKLTMLALGLCGAATLSACGDLNDGPQAPSTSDASAGELGLRLRIANGHNINSATYTITGPGGFSKTGSIDLSSATKISATIGGIPAGSGYSITLSATSDGADSCSGAATFNIVAHQTTPVTVPVACREPARTGSVGVTGALNICPVIDGIGANPAEVQVGGSVALSAAAHDSDAGPSPLTYAWTVNGGTLSNATIPNPTFTCGSTPGTVTIGLTVGDGDPAATCADTQTTQITCSTAAKTPGTYVAGDFHNHTTCSDGSISMQKLIKKATDKVETPWGLDWFVQAGHGGNGNRNCTLAEDATLATPAYPFVSGQGPTTTWENSGITPKGTSSGTSPNKNMWRWQSIQEFQYPLVEYMNAYKNIPLFIGTETVVPGHEHTSMSVLTGQIPLALDTATLPTTPGYTAIGNANALSQWEYCFDRNDTDLSRGVTNNWDCSVPGSANATDVSWNATGMKLVPSGTGVGTKGHAKVLEGLKWMAAFHPDLSYYVPAHLERAGQFYSEGNFGFNIEHLRDFNNTAPRIAFGFESQPGHGASDARGEYTVLRNGIPGFTENTDSVGGTTFGGTGVYAGYVGGVWDALLGEGRNWWFFASSDWHNRGTGIGADDRRTQQDFYPGEYQRNYTMVRAGTAKLRAQALVDGLRSGNNWASQGQLVDRLGFVACTGKADALVGELAANTATNNTTIDTAGCATMGEKLTVASGADIVLGIAVRDPEGANFSPYTFANPSLAQVGASVPLNKPVLDHIDVIGGLVTGYKAPGSADYAGAWPRNTAWLLADGTTAGLSAVPAAAKNTSTSILKTFNGNGASAWSKVISPVDGSTFLVMTFKVSAVTASQYFRLRGTNMQPSVPFETDASGNPLADVYTNAIDPTRLRIPCTAAHTGSSQFDGCPDHLKVATAPSPIAGSKAVSYDVAAWSDLWFYANPIYVQVNGSVVVAGVN